MIAVGVIAALLTALLTTRVGIKVSFGDDGLRLWAVVGFVKKELKLNASKLDKPEKKKKKEPKRRAKGEQGRPQTNETAEAPETASAADASASPEPSADTAPENAHDEKKKSFLDGYDKRKLIRLALDAVPRLLRLPRLDLLELHYVAGGETADKTAMRYGKMCAAMGAGLPFLRNGLKIKKEVITAGLDFTRVKQEISGKLQITVTIGAAFAFAIWALIGFNGCALRDKPAREEKS